MVLGNSLAGLGGIVMIVAVLSVVTSDLMSVFGEQVIDSNSNGPLKNLIQIKRHQTFHRVFVILSCTSPASLRLDAPMAAMFHERTAGCPLREGLSTEYVRTYGLLHTTMKMM